MLVPVLQPGDMVVLDNLRSHKVAGIEEAICAAGAHLLYLPPYSPDYNQIEQVFSKLKTLLRKTAARTVDALWSAIGELIGQFAPNECAQYIRHAGYSRSEQKGSRIEDSTPWVPTIDAMSRRSTNKEFP